MKEFLKYALIGVVVFVATKVTNVYFPTLNPIEQIECIDGRLYSTTKPPLSGRELAVVYTGSGKIAGCDVTTKTLDK